MNIEIHQQPYVRDKQLFHITTEHGGIEAIYTERTGIYLIANFDVGERRRGIGRELLRRCYEHARDVGAKGIVAAIISRECLESMTKVFGEEHIEVDKRGGYAPEGEDSNSDDPTSALLYLNMRDE